MGTILKASTTELLAHKPKTPLTAPFFNSSYPPKSHTPMGTPIHTPTKTSELSKPTSIYFVGPLKKATKITLLFHPQSLFIHSFSRSALCKRTLFIVSFNKNQL